MIVGWKIIPKGWKSFPKKRNISHYFVYLQPDSYSEDDDTTGIHHGIMRAAAVPHRCLYTRVAYLCGVTATLQDYRLQETE